MLKSLFSLSILGLATIIHIVKKILAIIFFPIYIIWRRVQRKLLKEYIKKYSSKGLLIIDFSEFIKKNKETMNL